MKPILDNRLSEYKSRFTISTNSYIKAQEELELHCMICVNYVYYIE